MKTILVVDDDNTFRTVIRKSLNRLGFEVLELASGKGLMELIDTHEIEAIILDIMMDERDGFETIMELNALLKRPKIVAVSSDLPYLSMAKSFGVDYTCTKPLSFNHLSDVLKKLEIVA